MNRSVEVTSPIGYSLSATKWPVQSKDEFDRRSLSGRHTFQRAAIDGGRLNRLGVEALDLSRSPQKAFEEYGMGGIARGGESRGLIKTPPS
jgi:hypothetical protein